MMSDPYQIGWNDGYAAGYNGRLAQAAMVSTPPTMSARILGILTRARGDFVSVEEISREVYGDFPPAEHLASVRCGVQRLRSALGRAGKVVSSMDGSYKLVGTATLTNRQALARKTEQSP